MGDVLINGLTGDLWADSRHFFEKPYARREVDDIDTGCTNRHNQNQ